MVLPVSCVDILLALLPFIWSGGRTNTTFHGLKPSLGSGMFVFFHFHDILFKLIPKQSKDLPEQMWQNRERQDQAEGFLAKIEDE